MGPERHKQKATKFVTLDGPGITVEVPTEVDVLFNDIEADYPPGLPAIVKVGNRSGVYGFCVDSGMLKNNVDRRSQVHFTDSQMEWLRSIRPEVERLLRSQVTNDLTEE